MGLDSFDHSIDLFVIHTPWRHVAGARSYYDDNTALVAGGTEEKVK